MIRATLIVLVLLATLGLAADTQEPACMAVEPSQMAYVVRVPEWPNFMGLRFQIKAKYGNRTEIAKAVTKVSAEKPVVVPKAKPVLQIVQNVRNVQSAKKAKPAHAVTKKAKYRANICKAPRHAVWRTLTNGDKKYRCVK